MSAPLAVAISILIVGFIVPTSLADHVNICPSNAGTARRGAIVEDPLPEIDPATVTDLLEICILEHDYHEEDPGECKTKVLSLHQGTWPNRNLAVVIAGCRYDGERVDYWTYGHWGYAIVHVHWGAGWYHRSDGSCEMSFGVSTSLTDGIRTGNIGCPIGKPPVIVLP